MNKQEARKEVPPAGPTARKAKKKKQSECPAQFSHCLSYSPNWDCPTTLAFHPALQLLAYASNNSVFVVDVLKQAPAAQLAEYPASKNRVRSVLFVGSVLILAKQSSPRLVYFDVDPEQRTVSAGDQHTLALKEPADSLLHYTESSAFCSTSGNSMILLVCDPTTHQLSAQYSVTIGMVARISCPLVDDLLALASANEVIIFDAKERKRTAKFTFPGKPETLQSLTSFSLSKDKLFLCATDRQAKLYVWEIPAPFKAETLRCAAAFDLPNVISKESRAVLPNDCCVLRAFPTEKDVALVYGSERGALRKLIFHQGEALTPPRINEEIKKNTRLVDNPHKASVFWLERGAKAELALSASFEGTIALWNLATESKEWNMGSLRSTVRCIVQPVDSRSKLLIGLTQNVKVWNIDTSDRYRVLDERRDLVGKVVFLFPMPEEESLVGMVEKGDQSDEFIVGVYHIYEEMKIQRVKVKTQSVLYAGWHFPGAPIKIEPQPQETAKPTKRDDVISELLARHPILPLYFVLIGSSRLLAYSLQSSRPAASIQLQQPSPHFSIPARPFDCDATAGTMIELSGMVGLGPAALVVAGYGNGMICAWLLLGFGQYPLLTMHDFGTGAVRLLSANFESVKTKEQIFEGDKQISAYVEGNGVCVFSVTKVLLQLRLIAESVHTSEEFAAKVKEQSQQSWKSFFALVDILK